MSNYPSIKEYLELYHAAAHHEGWVVNDDFAIPLITDMKNFLDLIYALGKGWGGID